MFLEQRRKPSFFGLAITALVLTYMDTAACFYATWKVAAGKTVADESLVRVAELATRHGRCIDPLAVGSLYYAPLIVVVAWLAGVIGLRNRVEAMEMTIFNLAMSVMAIIAVALVLSEKGWRPFG